MAIKAEGKPGGANGEMQYNDGCAFAGAPALNYDKTTDQIVVQGGANNTAAFSGELLANPAMEFNADGWSGAGWNWTPFTLTHDPLDTDPLSADAVVANFHQYVLVGFTVNNQTQGALQVAIGLDPSIVDSENGIVVTGNGSHVIVLRATADGSFLFFTPQPSGYVDVFDGELSFFSAVAITLADAVLISKLVDTSDGSLEVVLGDSQSLFLGKSAGLGNGPDAFSNLAIGASAMRVASVAGGNVAIGTNTLELAANASNNIAIGASALQYAQEATSNVAIGASSMVFGVNAGSNVAIGANALASATDAQQSIAIGVAAGAFLAHGIGNVLIGHTAGIDLTTANYQLRVSHPVAGTPLVAGDFQAQTLTIGGDLDFSANDQGPILIDRTTATRYRLYVDSGVLSIEVA